MDDLYVVVEKYIDNVLRTCVHYLGNMESAEDATEEVFYIAANKGILKSGGNLLPKLLYIARKVCIADTIKDDNEEYFLTKIIGLSKKDYMFVTGHSKFYLSVNLAGSYSL